MSKIEHRLGQNADQLLIEEACYSNGHERPVRRNDTVQAARLAFLNELGSVCGLGRDQLGDITEAFPC